MNYPAHPRVQTLCWVPNKRDRMALPHPGRGKRVTVPRGGTAGKKMMSSVVFRLLGGDGRQRAGRSDAARVIGCESGAAVLAARAGSSALPAARRGGGRLCWPRLV